MAAGPLKRCGQPGCVALVRGGRCDKHKRPNTSTTRHQALYADTRWTKASQRFRRLNPLCAACLADGRTTAAKCVDHIEPHGGEFDRFWDQDNWQALCWSCHSRKTMAERTGARTPPTASAKMIDKDIDRERCDA